MSDLVRDLRYCVATLRRTPGLAVTVLLTFALGIGTTTAVFSVVHGVLLRPLAYPDSERLVRIWEEHPGGTTLAGQRWLSNRTLSAWSASVTALEGLGGFATYDMTVSFAQEGEPLKAVGSQLSPSVFGLLRATPALGRFFQAGEEREGSNRVVVISDRLWRERYGSAPDVLGRTFVIEGDAHTIVGVSHPSLEFPDARVLFWVPYVIPDVVSDSSRTAVFSAIGRLRAGITAAQAEAEGTAAARSMPRPQSADLLFGKGGPVAVHVRPLVEDMTAPVRPALLVVAAAVILLLVIACANVANLFLSRGIARQRELVIRVAVGASRARLLRQLLTESAALSLAGGSLGVLLAWLLVGVLPALAPARLPRLDDVRIDATVLGFGLLASFACGILAGLAPALRASRFELFQSIRNDTVGEGAGARGPQARRLRHGLLIVECATAVVLVVGAGLLARSFARLIQVDAGYDASHVLTAQVQMPRGTSPERTAQFIDAMLARLRSLPGVTAAGAGSMMPMMRMTAISTFTLPGWVSGDKPATARALTYTITPGYPEALQLRLKAGRVFTEADARAGVRPILVNEDFVRQYISRTAVGLRLGPLYSQDKGIETEIVGVVGNVLKDGNDRQPQPEIYFPHGFASHGIVRYVNFLVRTAGDPSRLTGEVRGLIRELDRHAVVERIDPLKALVAASVEQPRFGVTVLTGFAALAVALAAVGLYGVLSYNVSQRRRELGVRAALGADRANLVGLVLREAIGVTIVGALAGLLAAGALTRLIRSLLFGISPMDAPTFVVALVVVVGVGLAAGVLPALRAASIDPARALREG